MASFATTAEAAFEPADSFDGPRPGKYFKKGDQGLGYYADLALAPAAPPQDETTARLLAEGYFDITVERDYGVMKRIVRKGESSVESREPPFPVEGCPTFVQFVGRLLDGRIFDSSRDVVDGKNVGGTDDPLEFQLLRGKDSNSGKVVLGWDLGVATMVRGEVASFVIREDYAFGSVGFPPKVLPGATVMYDIELLSWKDPLPRFPSKEEMEASKKRRAEEERQEMLENPPPTLGDRIKDSNVERSLGNKLYAEGNFEEAKKKYDTAFVHIFIGKDDWEHLLNQKQRDMVNACKLPLHLNRGMCKLKQGKYEDALWDCDKAIELDETNVKGFYRRTIVHTEFLKAELAKEERGEFWVTEKAWAWYSKADADLKTSYELGDESDYKLIRRAEIELKKAHNTLKRYTKEYERQQKALYKKKIMEPIERKNRKLREKELREAALKEEEDLPELDDD